MMVAYLCSATHLPEFDDAHTPAPRLDRKYVVLLVATKENRVTSPLERLPSNFAILLRAVKLPSLVLVAVAQQNIEREQAAPIIMVLVDRIVTGTSQ
jgi:hypothetical protein